MNEELLKRVTDALNRQDISYETKVIHALDDEELYGIIVKDRDVNAVQNEIRRERGYEREDVYDDHEWGKCWIVY